MSCNTPHTVVYSPDRLYCRHPLQKRFSSAKPIHRRRIPFAPLLPSSVAIFHSTCKFSQLLLLLSFKHILLRISLARFRLRTVLLLCNFDSSLPLLPCRRSFFSRVSLKRICFKTPTRSSSTLCLSPLDVSINLHSRDVANCFPSLTA